MLFKKKILMAGISKELFYTLQLVQSFLPYEKFDIYVYDHLSKDIESEFKRVYGQFNSNLVICNEVKFISFTEIDKNSHVIICSDAFRAHLLNIFKEFSNVENWRQFVVKSGCYIGKYIIPRVDIPLTQRCTLNCTFCNMYVPHVKKPVDINLELIISDIDKLFQQDRFIGFIHLVGGEPFLFKGIADIIKKCSYYKKAGRLSDIWITTNGAVKYNMNDLNEALEAKARIFVTDYSSSVPKVAKLTKKNINLLTTVFKDKILVNEEKEWIDFGHPNIVYETDEAKLHNHFKKCTVPYRGLRNGRFYYCNLSIAAEEAGFPQDIETCSISLDETTNEEIIKYDLGNIGQKYLSLCKSCAGCNTGVGKIVSPSSQGLREENLL